MTATSTLPTASHGISTMGAFLLAVAGTILVVVIAATAVALAAVAAVVVFGSGVLDSF